MTAEQRLYTPAEFNAGYDKVLNSMRDGNERIRGGQDFMLLVHTGGLHPTEAAKRLIELYSRRQRNLCGAVQRHRNCE